MTGVICNFLNEIQDKHVYTHEDIIKASNGEGVFIYHWFEKAQYYFDMKAKGYKVETNIDEILQ